MACEGRVSTDRDADTASSPGEARARWLLAASALAYFVAQGVFVPTVPRLLSEGVGASAGTVGLVLATFSVVALLARIPKLDGHAPVRLACCGGALVVASAGVLASATLTEQTVALAIALVVLARATAGAGDALYYPSAATAFVAGTPERVAAGMSRFTAVVYTGLLIGPAVGDAVWSWAGYQAAWLLAAASAAIAVLFVVPGMRSAPRPRPPVRPSVPGPAGRLVPAGVLLPGLLVILMTLPSAGFSSFAALYATDLGQPSAAIDLFVYAAVVIAGRLGSASFLDRFSAATNVVVSGLLSAAGCIVVLVVPTPVGFVIGAAGIGAGQVGGIPALYATALRRAPRERRRHAMAVLTGCHDVAFGAGVAGLGLVLQLAGFTGLFLAAAAASVLAVLSSRCVHEPVPTATTDPIVVPPIQLEENDGHR